MLRGGAFNNNQRNARCSYRNNNDPDNRNNNIGFRVVLSTLVAGNVCQVSITCQNEANGGVRSWPRFHGNRANSNGPIPWPAWDGATPHMIAAGAFSELTAWGNLLSAYHGAGKGKRSRGEVAAFEYRLEEHLLGLQTSLLEGTWRPGGYHSFLIHDPKQRLISAAPFADRVVHHALCNIIEPDFERSFVEESFANRKGKGNHSAIALAQRHARRYPYVLSLDIRKFFPNIDHAVLFSLLSGKIEDRRVLRLIQLILDSGDGIFNDASTGTLFPGDDLLDLLWPRGLPIGNLTSQFWANVYLNPLDHFIKRELRCKGYVRYVDDLLLFADDKAQLWEWRQRLVERLSRYRLVFHSGSHPRPVNEGFGFLGFMLFPERRRVKKRKGFQYQRKLVDLVSGYQQGSVTGEELLDSVMAWNNHLSYGNTVGLRKAVFSCLPPEIAIMARQQWRRSLVRRGVRG
ncbi:MAG: reverse transcriptase domain-containing protein [Candidatus Sedimenticola sp. (ex Thyasira tokunagai)]